MAKADVLKFRELLFTDAEFREKFRKAAESYTGEKNEQAVFDNLLLPLAEEHGLSATFEEFKTFADNFGRAEGELSDDELEQVAGGKSGGAGGFSCLGVGIGLGGGGGSNGDEVAGGGCLALGFGLGNMTCFGEGQARHL